MEDKKEIDTDEGIVVYLEFTNTREEIGFNINTPNMAERGIRRWIRKELHL